MSSSKHKKLLVVVFGGLLLIGLMFYWWQDVDTLMMQHSGDTLTNEYTWLEYKNSDLDFAVAYPAEISQPQEVSHPPSIDGIFPGADRVIFYGASTTRQYHLSIWVQDTNATNATEWFNEVYGPDGKGYYISATSAVDGKTAVSVSEKIPGKARDGYDLNFVHEDKAYSLHIDDSRFSQEEIEYIRKSFRFLSWWEHL